MPKHGKSFLIAVIFLFFFRILPSFPEVVDKILVVVNDEIITQGEIDRIMLPIYAQYKGMYTGRELEEEIEAARHRVLAGMVDDKLLLIEAKRKETEVTDKEVEKKVEKAKSRFATEEDFAMALAQDNMVLSELKERFKERVMIEKFVDSEIRGKILISPSELLDFYKSNLSEFQDPPKAKAKSILVKINRERSKQDALRVAEQVLYRLKEGGNFELLAKQFSDGPYAEAGGEMGWIEKGKLLEEIDSLIFSMEKGELSGILETNIGFHILMVEDKIDARTREFIEEKDGIEQFLYGKKRAVRLRRLIDRLKESAYIVFK